MQSDKFDTKVEQLTEEFKTTLDFVNFEKGLKNAVDE